MRRALSAFLALAIAALPAVSHDFWIEPSAFRPAAPGRIELQLRVGERFAGELVPRRGQRIERFVAVDAQGRERDVPGIEQRSPAGRLSLHEPGLVLVGYLSTPTPIELEAEKFERYLREEGLEHVIAERARRGESAHPGREAYARCARALILAQGETPREAAQPTGFDRRLKFPLEIVPDADPCALASGAELGARVLWRGAPLEGALLGCVPKDDPAQEPRIRTDADGRARFQLGPGTVHLLRVVHMVRAPAGAGHDWESFWGSLTFECRAR